MFKKFLSRKLVVLVFGAVAVPLMQKWNVPPDTIDWLLTTIVAYLGVQGAVDTVVALKTTAPAPTPTE